MERGQINLKFDSKVKFYINRNIVIDCFEIANSLTKDFCNMPKKTENGKRNSRKKQKKKKKIKITDYLHKHKEESF